MNNHNFLQILKNRFEQALFGLLLVILLSACGTSAPTPSAEAVIAGAQTAVAETITSQPLPSVTEIATASATVTPTYSIPTTIVVTATSYSVNTYGTYSVCEDSSYVKDVTIPDGTVLTPGESFVKTWRFKNTGSCTWTDYYSIVFIDGYEMDGSDTPIDLAVGVDKRVDVSVSLTAPDEVGTYTGYWQLADEYGYTFGDVVYITIIVAEPTATSAPTATDTSTPTSVSIAISTPTPTLTSTTIPDDTETDTSVPTLTPKPVSDTDISTPTSEPVSTNTPILTEAPTEDPTATP